MIVDLVIIAILALSVFLGYKKGLVSLAIGLFAFLIAIVVTFVLCKPISSLIINNTKIDENITNSIVKNVEGWLEKGEEKEVNNKLIASAKEGALEQTARSLAENIIFGAVMLVLFVGVRIALIFVSAIANLVAKIPILKQFNKVGGLLYGALRGLLIVYVALIIVNVWSQFSPNNVVNKNLSNSYVGKAMSEYNIFNVIF